LESDAQSDMLDAVVVGGFQTYSRVPLADAARYQFDQECEGGTDKRSIVLAAVFFSVQLVLVIETVFVVLFGSGDPDDPVGSVTPRLLGLALFANFVAAIAAAGAADADKRSHAGFRP
jgi:hypothetical protein